MDKNVINILKDIADKHRIKPFIKRELLNALLLIHLEGKFKNEIKLLIRISNAGYISSLAKMKNINNEKERIAKCLYDDESIDKNIASEAVDLLSNVIKYACDKEMAYDEEMKKQAIIKNAQEKSTEFVKMKDVLENSFTKIIKSYGIGILNNFNFCRALLKDMAQGNYVDEIMLISLLLKKQIQKKILKPRVFKIKADALIFKLSNNYMDIHNLGVDTKIIIELIVNAIDNSVGLNTTEGGKKEWATNFFGFLKK
jgi:hypothetical protein